MAATTQRPAQYKQTSRKGKSAWRKNIDLTDIEKSLESKVEDEITHGKENLTEVPASELFQIDVEGDEVLKSKLIKRKQIKKHVKSTEILDAIKSNSKVNALVHPKISIAQNDRNSTKKKIQGVSKKEVTRLMALAGKQLGESKLKTHISKHGLVKTDNAFDIWGSEQSSSVQLPSGITVKVSKEHIPEEVVKKSTSSWSIATVPPSTIKRAPELVKDLETEPHAGKSYHPDPKHWKSLIDKEYAIESVKEVQRAQMAEYKQKIEHLIATLNDNQEDSSSDGEEGSGNEEEQEHLSDEDVVKLSINPAVKNKKKTKYQRNKHKRHQEKLKLQQELKQLRAQLKELENLHDVEAEVVEKRKHENKVTKPPKQKKHHKLGTKHSVIDNNLEVKFSDELSDSLRKLRPEGNLLYDNVRKLQSTGKVESRIPVRKGRRYKPKITEKWTYKDFK